MNCELIMPVQNLDISIEFLPVDTGIFLAKKQAPTVTSIFANNTSLKEQIGTDGVNDIYKDPVFHLFASREDLQKISGSDDIDTHSYILASEALRYFLSLWIIKDNSCYCPRSFYLFDNRTQIRSQTINLFLSNSKGLYATVDFSEIEMIHAFNFSKKLTDLFADKELKQYNAVDYLRSVDGSGSVIAADHKHFSTNRIERAFLMLVVARSTVELAMKLSFYMSTFECLFTTDSSEISNKIVQRVTLFLGGTRDEMLKNKDTIKKAYSIRSGFLHGSTPKPKLTTKESLVEISTAIDELLRAVFIKVVEKESKVFLSKDSKDLDKYFDSFVYREYHQEVGKNKSDQE